MPGVAVDPVVEPGVTVEFEEPVLGNVGSVGAVVDGCDDMDDPADPEVEGDDEGVVDV